MYVYMWCSSANVPFERGENGGTKMCVCGGGGLEKEGREREEKEEESGLTLCSLWQAYIN